MHIHLRSNQMSEAKFPIYINYIKMSKFVFSQLLSLVIALTMVFKLELIALANIPANSSLADTVASIIPAVVNISTTQKNDIKKRNDSLPPDNPYDLFRDFLEKEFGLPEQMRKITSLGSGFIVDPNGYIVTNQHVVDGADEVTIILSNEKQFKAQIIGQDKKTDLAVLKIDTKEQLPYIEFDDSEQARVGDAVIAVGNPFGLGGTVTSGIISAKARHITANTYDDYIQTDAAINRGNSGGPLCSAANGKVIGVNSVIFSPSGGSVGIGFAIPSSIVKPVVSQLKDKGKIIRGWLGVKVQQVNEDIASIMGIQDSKGALVASVVKGSPADKAGVKIGDIIVKFDNQEVLSMNKLPRMVAETPLNKKVNIEVFRDNKYLTLSTLIEKPSNDDPFSEDQEDESEDSSGDDKDKQSKGILGITVKSLTPEIRRMYGLSDSDKGVVVISVDRGSVASFVGMKPGDLIITVNNKPINSSNEFNKALEKLKSDGKGKAMMLVSRKGNTSYITIEVK